MSTVPAEYYEHARTELLRQFSGPPRRLLDVGCGAGATSAAAKARWPGLETIGIELVAEIAERARTVLDRVVQGSVETLDFAAAGIAEVDGVLLGDVLEHMVDPWAFLRRLRSALSPEATVVASIPNIANLWVIEQLAVGRFQYEPSGLLDRTHLRFFTHASIEELFGQSGYRIARWDRVVDGRVDDLTSRRIFGVALPRLIGGRLRGRRVRISGIGRQAYEDLRTFQYLVVAHPAGSPHSEAAGT
jgi:trans-aconitate methyltransferase